MWTVFKRDNFTKKLQENNHLGAKTDHAVSKTVL